MEKIITYGSLEPDDLFDNSLPDTLFQYSEEEVEMFHEGFDYNTNKHMLNSVSKALKNNYPTDDLKSSMNSIIQFLQTLTPDDLKIFERHMEDFAATNPNMLWNMLHKKDKKFYSTPDKFYDWLSRLSDNEVDKYIFRAADGRKLHSDDMYIKEPITKVEILDGYIAVSSSNLEALDRFKDRIMLTNTCSYHHRIKKHGDVTIHSYVFNMNKTSD
tara:strand:- start:2017 stop:2661 length:645 start_codon:yes stop_codon:yes gene_type:complete